MKIWILLAIAGALLLWSLVRERFEATASIRAPPYDENAKIGIFQVANTANQRILIERATQLVTTPTTDPDYRKKLEAAAGGIVAPVVGEFFNTVFKPATTPITNANVEAFMAPRTSDLKAVEEQILKTYFVGQQGIGTAQASGYADVLASMGQNVGYLVTGSGEPLGEGALPGVEGASPPSGTAASTAASASEGDWEEGPAPVCPAGTTLRSIAVGEGDILDDSSSDKCFGAETRPFTCPNDYEPVPGASGKPCRRVGGTETANAVCPSGYQYNETLGECETTPQDPTCPGGYRYREGKCMKRRGAAASTTTGGGSTSMRGPTSGGPANRLRQVFGPVFTERGNEVSAGGNGNGDSSQTNIYPELLGGQIDRSSRIPGVGVVPPSKNWTIANDGSLPSKSSMGSDDMARFFPFSRMPGDMDIVPDPYRVAKTFSQSSYSSKTEPAPFLTDFSAFLK